MHGTRRLLSLAGAGFAMVAAAAWGAVPPVDSAGPAASPNAQIEATAREYGFSLMHAIAQVEQQYVRPVARADLVEAALNGLYEAARQPVPPVLHEEVQRLNDGELVAFLGRARESLGDHDALRGPRAVLVSLGSLARALDPYCTLTGRKEFQLLDQDENAPQTGLEFPLTPTPPALMTIMPGRGRFGDGIEAPSPSLPAGPVRVTAVQPGSPGQKAGIRPGDLVVAVNGKPSHDAGFATEFRRLLPIPSGVPVNFSAHTAPIKLRILREGAAQPIEATLIPAAYQAESVFGVRRRADGSWDYVFDPAGRIGYIRLGLIQSHTASEFAEAMKSLRAPNLRGLILDLRWCPGGYLRQAATIARALLGDNQALIATQRDRFGRLTPVEAYAIDNEPNDFPIVVLVNGATSGGGELIAAALQDHGRAAVAGQRTVGKASVQEPLDRYGIPLKITTSMLLRPGKRSRGGANDDPPKANAKSLEPWVINPDPGREIPTTHELSERLKQWWMLHTLRPAGNNEALPVDDPESDPQRLAALQMLRGLIGK